MPHRRHEARVRRVREEPADARREGLQAEDDATAGGRNGKRGASRKPRVGKDARKPRSTKNLIVRATERATRRRAAEARAGCRTGRARGEDRSHRRSGQCRDRVRPCAARQIHDPTLRPVWNGVAPARPGSARILLPGLAWRAWKLSPAGLDRRSVQRR